MRDMRFELMKALSHRALNPAPLTAREIPLIVLIFQLGLKNFIPIVGMENDNKYVMEAKLSVEPQPHPFLNASDLERHDAEYRRIWEQQNQTGNGCIHFYGLHVRRRA